MNVGQSLIFHFKFNGTFIFQPTVYIIDFLSKYF